MALKNMQHQDMSLVLSSDAKPRLKWTPELHQRFVDAVTQLGGPDKTGGSRLNDTVKKPLGGTGYSLESSLTSSESSGRKEDNLPKHKTDDSKDWNRSSVVLPLMEMQPGEKSASSNQGHGRRRSGSTISDGNWIEQPSGKRSFGSRKTSDDQLRKSGYLGTLDLNSQYLNDYDSGPRALDLNCKGLEQLDGHL
ncbi:hypothetical protein RJ640_007883 [Escallonia rubra]|uniref:Uncharacterized protein n=1 Tax=Escallonia rubra TaxID=112253 RepID=A0AA88QFY6_9ASTE|nr:hypothetical protein RJ640_007883 [Escallonia rubra]